MSKQTFDPRLHLMQGCAPPGQSSNSRHGSASEDHRPPPESAPPRRSSDSSGDHRGYRSTTPMSLEEQDAELARRLQRQLIEDQKKAEEKELGDLELARRLQKQEDERRELDKNVAERRNSNQGSSSQHQRSSSAPVQVPPTPQRSSQPRHTRQISMEEQDAVLARRLQEEHERMAAVTQRSDSQSDGHDDDLALALRLSAQEMDRQPSDTTERGIVRDAYNDEGRTRSQSESDYAIQKRGQGQEDGNLASLLSRRDIPNSAVRQGSIRSLPASGIRDSTRRSSGGSLRNLPPGPPLRSPSLRTIQSSPPSNMYSHPLPTRGLAAAQSRSMRSLGPPRSQSMRILRPLASPSPSTTFQPTLDPNFPPTSAASTSSDPTGRRNSSDGRSRPSPQDLFESEPPYAGATPDRGPAPIPPPSAGKKKKRGILNSFRGNRNPDGKQAPPPSAPVPAAIPPPPIRTPGPLPYSVSVSSPIPVAPHPLLTGGGPRPRRGGSLLSGRQDKTPAVTPNCDICGKPATSFLATLDKKFHSDCFRCVGCHKVIDPSGHFAFMTDEEGGKNPLHRSCYAELYGVKCAVCMESIPAGSDGKVSYVKHPFFDSEQMCPKHASNPGRRCSGCHRFEPIGDGFADLGDSNRCVCFSCCRSVVVDSEDAKPLWDKVIRFFEQELGLPIWPDLREVPILVVGFDALNDQLQNSPHGGSSQIMTRGLCLSEHESGRRFEVPRLKYDRSNRSFRPRDVEAKGYTYMQVPDANKINPDSSVTAILCLSGLPADLTASVLAHEATHAWIKLHPSFDILDPIPLMVEEGCCQLMALLFLNDGLDPASTVSPDDKGPSEEKLRQYFKFSIETDDNEIYGTGYRMAAKAYAAIGMQALMSHVVLYKEFPET